MKKIISIMLSVVMCLSLVACSKTEEKTTFTGEAKGYAGAVTATVELDGEKIVSITVEGANETDGIGSKAIESLPAAMVEAQSTQVDVMTGATVTSNAIIEAVNAALTEAGIDPSKLTPSNTGSSDKTEETKDVDVVILGAGGAGLTAAIEAGNAGKSVLVVEIAAIAGGNTTRATGGMNAAKTLAQDTNEFTENAGVESMLEKAKTYPELEELRATVEKQYNDYLANPTGYFDSVELFTLDTLVGGGNLNNRELVDTLIAGTAPAVDWLTEIGCELSLVGSFGGASVKRIHKPVVDGKSVAVGSFMVPVLEKAATNAGAEILFETSADEIIMTDGVATGVKASSAKTNYTINAKAVIVATGGFGANEELFAKYDPSLAGFVTTNAPTIQGDGIVMVENAGGALKDIELIQIHPTVEQATSALITEGLRGDGAIMVNQEGVRFCDEVGTRNAVSASIIAQTGSYAYLIVDQKMVDASAVIAGYITKGLTVEGETVEDLATAMEVDPATLVATMDSWNAAVEAGSDAQFERTSFAEKLDTGKFYAIKIAPGVHHTMGGVEINTNTEVISTTGDVIPGLFAAGEVTGGIHGNNRLGGNAVADIVVFGRIAGQSAAAYVG